MRGLLFESRASGCESRGWNLGRVDESLGHAAQQRVCNTCMYAQTFFSHVYIKIYIYIHVYVYICIYMYI